MCLCLNRSGSDWSEKLLAATWFLGVVYVWRQQEATVKIWKQQWRLPKVVSVDAATASVISELESISLFKEAQRTALEA